MANAIAINIINTRAVILSAFFIAFDIGYMIIESGKNAKIRPDRQEGKYRKPTALRQAIQFIIFFQGKTPGNSVSLWFYFYHSAQSISQSVQR